MPGGRPSKLTPAVAERIAKALEQGMPQETAAKLAGVEPRTFYEWMAQGRREDGRHEYQQFAQAVTLARATFQESVIAEIRNAFTPGEHGVRDWRALAWLMERMFPEQFGQTVQVRMKVDEELTTTIDRLRKGLDPETFGRVVDILADDGIDATDTGESGNNEG